MTKFFLSVFFIAFNFSILNASEILNTAHQLRKGELNLSVYYTNTSRDINFSIETATRVVVGGESYYTKSLAKFDSEILYREVGAKVNFNPFDGLYYWLKGAFGKSELKMPTLDGNIKFTDGARCRFALGVRKLLFPDTIVTPALAVETAFEYGRASLKKLHTNDGDAVADAVLENKEYRLAFIGSKRFGVFEPYGAVKVSRIYSDFVNMGGSGNFSGNVDNVGLTAGLKVNFEPRESFTIEASFLNERSVSAAINLVF